MCTILKNQKAAQNLLTTIFKDYVKYLNKDYSDAEGLFSNISAYYTLKNNIPFLSSNGYDLIATLDEKSKENSGTLFRLLRQKYDLKNKGLPKYTSDEEIKRLKLKGCILDLEQL